MAEALDAHDELDPSLLLGVAGMTPDAFASQTAALGTEAAFEVESEDEVPGRLVLRADYDNVRRALAAESQELAALTDANRSIADAMVYVSTAGRIFARLRGLEPTELGIEQSAATEATLIFRIAPA